MSIFKWGRIRQFNSKSYNKDFVRENDEFQFLLNTLGSFTETGIITELATIETPNRIANIHVETKDKTLIKWLIKFDFEEVK